MNIENKVAIVTGASSGIGLAIVQALVKAKVRVTLIARDITKLNEITTELKANNGSALALAADISDPDQLIHAIQKSHEYWQQTDILINNAGVCIATNFHAGNKEDWQYMWQVNVFAPCVAVQEVLKYFTPDRGGHIINISSTSAYRIVKGGSFYSATKFALRAVSEALRKELIDMNSKTRVSSISPGFVNTAFAKSSDFILPDNTNKEKLDPQDVAATVIYILQTPHHVGVDDVILRSTKQYN